MQQTKTQKSPLEKQREYNNWLRRGGDQITWTTLKTPAWKLWEEGRISENFNFVFVVAHCYPNREEGYVYIFRDGDRVEGLSEVFDRPFNKGEDPYEKCHNFLKKLKYEEIFENEKTV